MKEWIDRHFEEQLILTGFSIEQQEMLESFSYENRKAGALQADSLNRYFEAEHRKLEQVVKSMNSKEFVKIDRVIDKIKQLNDICNYDYLRVLRLFDASFTMQQDYYPEFQPLPPELLESSLLDLYYVVADMDISTSVFNAISALLQLRLRIGAQDRKILNLKDNLKKLQGILKHIFTNAVLELLIKITKKDIDFLPAKATYTCNARKKYADFLQDRFRVDEERLKTEIQDETITHELNTIFGEQNLIPVNGYSNELNNQLKHSTPCSFAWVLPLQILKTFLKKFYDDNVKSLLNDIVIEGFFNNPSYKSDFSSAVFACNESTEKIEYFEQLFNRGNQYDEANITGLIHDSHKDAGFEMQLREIVEKINREAKQVLQSETNNLFLLYKKIADILVESKKPSSDVISNLKVLLISSRNRDNAEKLESQHEQWKVFLEIMKNYVIIGSVDKK